MLSINKVAKFAIANLMIVSTVFSTVTPAIAQSEKEAKDDSFAVGNTKNPKNVIFLVGDGMGPSFNTAYRYYKNDPHAKEMNTTAFDAYLKGTNRTYSNDPKQNITDSAAGATAFSSGHKTYNGAIGVDSNKQKVKTVLERAKEKGKSTGLVSTAEITDATPAAYASHVTSRDDKNEIAQQFYKDKINGKHKVDVLLSGGAKYFGKSNGNLDKKFKKDGYELVRNSKELSKSKSEKVLGLFADKNMPLAIDASKKEPSLADMQQSALSKLEQNKKGFFLMVKGEDPEKVINDGYGLSLSNDDMKQIKKENKKLQKLLKRGKDEKSAEIEKQTKILQHAIQKSINDKYYTGWTSDGHTGEDVNTYAYGPKSDAFSGNIENTESAKIIFDIFK
ncbi:alkaline phosphatase [Staphylococcus roterodami]|nr:alkaline phosphatase [Staphylococcus roterodami]